MMKRFRSRLLVALFFGLISLGQAYPYAFAYALSQAKECSCNRSGHECIHGCDLKKRKRFKKPIHHGSPAQAPASGEETMPCHGQASSKEETSPQFAINFRPGVPSANKGIPVEGWVSPSCSKQHQQEVLRFQGDPFIPITFTNFTLPSFEETGPVSHLPIEDRLPSCEDPPPKE